MATNFYQIFTILHWHTDDLQPALSYRVTFEMVMTKKFTGILVTKLAPSNKNYVYTRGLYT